MSRFPMSSASFSLLTLCIVLIAFTRISTSHAAKYGDSVQVDGLRIPIWGALFTTDEDPAIILAACQYDVNLLFPSMKDYVDCYDIQDDTDRILPSYRTKIEKIAQSPPVRLTIGLLPGNGTIQPSIKELEDEVRTFMRYGRNETYFNATTNTIIINPSKIAQRILNTPPGSKDALRILDKIPHYAYSKDINITDDIIGISSTKTQLQQILSLVEMKQDTLVYCANAIPNEYVLTCENDNRYYAGQIGLGVAVTVAVFMLIFVASCTYGIWNKHEQQRKRNNRRNVKKDKQKLILGDHNTDFKQQRLNVWTPHLTYPWVISTYAVIAILFIPIGWFVVFQQLDLVDISVRYDNLGTSCPVNTNTDPYATPTATCSISIPIQRDMFPPVYVYYQVSNLYQNHRRYINSVGFKQLRNDGRSYADCAPKQTFQTSASSPYASENDKKLYPCGLIAQSFFTDSFSEPCILTSDVAGCNTLQWERTGIAWKSDLDRRFKENFNPASETRRNAYRGYNMPSVENEDFVVWMRASAMPTFTKLYAVIKTKLNQGEILKLQINNNYDVSSFSGEKAIVLSTVSRIGGRNIFMGVAYILFGFLSMIMAIVFYVRYRLNRADKDD